MGWIWDAVPIVISLVALSVTWRQRRELHQEGADGVWATLASSSKPDGQPYKAQPNGWIMYVVRNDTGSPARLLDLANIKVGKMIEPRSTLQVRPPDDLAPLALNEPVHLQFEFRGRTWRRDESGKLHRLRRQRSH